MGDTLLSTCWFFQTTSPFSRKLCLLGCSSKLKDRRKKSGALGTAVVILTPKEMNSSTGHKNQYTPQLPSQIPHVIQVLPQRIASLLSSTHKTQAGVCLSRDTEEKKYIHTYSFSTLPSAVLRLPTKSGHNTSKSSLLCDPAGTISHAQRSSLATAAKQHIHSCKSKCFSTALQMQNHKGKLGQQAALVGKRRAHWCTAPTGHWQHPAHSNCIAEGCWAQVPHPFSVQEP